MPDRNPQYQFVSTDTTALETELIAHYEAITQTTVQPASPERLLIQWVAATVVQLRVLANYIGNQNIPSRAEGSNLDALAELTYIKARPSATAAACTVRFQISEPQTFAVLIPADTRLTDAGKTLVWSTTTDVYVPVGETSVDAEVICQTPGTVGNGYVAGQINKLVDLYDYYSKCANITVSDGGSDIPDDDAFYQLMRESMDAYSCAGSRGSYIYFAKQVSAEIGDVIANAPAPGCVNLYVLMNDGTIATEEVKRAVLEACSAEEVRPLTDLVAVEDPEVVPYDIQLTYYVPQNTSVSTVQLQDAVNDAVQQHIRWQCAKLGRDINPSHLIGLIMQTGIKRVDLMSPMFTDLNDGTGGSTPQIASVRNISVTNGGFENE